MNPFDYVILFIVGFSMLLAGLRGALREITSLLGWLLAFWGAVHYGDLVAQQLIIYLPVLGEKGAKWSGWIGTFIGVMIIMALIGILLKKMAQIVGLGLLDRLFGLFFGLLRGVLIVGILFFVMLSFDMEMPKIISRSYLAPYFLSGVMWMSHLFPEGSPHRVQFNTNLTTWKTHFDPIP
ncbi:MAG: CvpA family protein [Magnetococcus sp. DMHC-6]